MKKLTLKTIGIDAEVFLRNKETNEIISAEGYIKGSKHRPQRFDPTNKWFTTQLDNVLAEFTIPPSATVREFAKGITVAFKHLRKILPKNVEPVIQASANLNEKYLMTEQAMMFGCEPDFNAYTHFINEKPYCEDHTLRSCGSHIHLGYDGVEVKYKDNIFNYEVDEQRANIVQTLDLFVSVPLVIMEPDSDRKLLYGKAGAFRPKPYGLEYRTPSNWYLSSSKLIKWAYNNTRKGFNHFATNGRLDKDVSEHVREVINTNNKTDANELIKYFKLQLA